MKRRNFLMSAAVFAAALVTDPEKLLWEPSKKTIFIPPARVLVPPVRLLAGLCAGHPVYWDEIEPSSVGPITYYPGGGAYRIVELKEGRHLYRANTTIFAIPGGKLSLQVGGPAQLCTRYL